MIKPFKYGILLLVLNLAFFGYAQKAQKITIFKNQPLNFNGKLGDTSQVKRFQDGRIILKKVTVPKYSKGTDVKVNVNLRSAGDRWDKSGSLFVITDPEKINITDILKEKTSYPKAAGQKKYPGIKLAGWLCAVPRSASFYDSIWRRLL